MEKAPSKNQAKAVVIKIRFAFTILIKLQILVNRGGLTSIGWRTIIQIRAKWISGGRGGGVRWWAYNQRFRVLQAPGQSVSLLREHNSNF